MMSFENVTYGYTNNGFWSFRKSREQHKVLNNINFNISDSTCFGLIGPNGSGKSTIVKLALGLLECDSGRVLYDGKARPGLSSEDWRESLGFVSGASSRLFSSLTLEEHFHLYKSVYRLFDHKIFFSELKRYDIEKRMKHKPSSISFGERIKFEILLTLACKPKVLMLDEPTVGLDPIAISEVRELLKLAFSQTGIVGIITSHNLGDICSVAKYGAFLKDGQLVRNFSAEETDQLSLEHAYFDVFGSTKEPEAAQR